MRISTKLMLSFSIVALIILLAGGVVMITVSKISDFVDELTNAEIPKLTLNSAIVREISSIIGDVNYLAYSANAKLRAQSYENVRKDVESLKRDLSEMDSMGMDESERVV